MENNFHMIFQLKASQNISRENWAAYVSGGPDYTNSDFVFCF